MKGDEVLRHVEAMHREKNIPREVIFEGIEAALLLAARKHFEDEEADVAITIDRETGQIEARYGEVTIDPQVLGRIAAQSAKQVMIQKIREAECNAVYDDYVERKGELVMGIVQRFEGGNALVTVEKSESFLPRSEMIPGETHHVGQRIKAVILDVRKVGSRVRIVLSRTHPDFVRRLFEQEIPEISDRTIDIRAVAREAGYRTKIAVSSIDSKVDAVGACVGVRGSRIKNITSELNEERIDIVRWNDSLQVMIPNALQPATIEEVMLYPRIGRAIVLVKEDQLSLAIGRRGQNVRLASKLVGWDIEIMTHEELAEAIERAENWFRQIPELTDEMVEVFIEQGFLYYDELTYLEPAQMAELIDVNEEQATAIIAFAEDAAEKVEEEEPRSRAAAAEADRPAAPTAADILGEAPAAQTTEEPTPTVESIFGPGATDKPAEEKLSAEQIFGETAAAPPTEEKKDDEA